VHVQHCDHRRCLWKFEGEFTPDVDTHDVSISSSAIRITYKLLQLTFAMAASAPPPEGSVLLSTPRARLGVLHAHQREVD
jgi:hypothetical protein